MVVLGLVRRDSHPILRRLRGRLLRTLYLNRAGGERPAPPRSPAAIKEDARTYVVCISRRFLWQQGILFLGVAACGV